MMWSKASFMKPSATVSGDTARCCSSARRYAASALTRCVPNDGGSSARRPAATCQSDKQGTTVGACHFPVSACKPLLHALTPAHNQDCLGRIPTTKCSFERHAAHVMNIPTFLNIQVGGPLRPTGRNHHQRERPRPNLFRCVQSPLPMHRCRSDGRCQPEGSRHCCPPVLGRSFQHGLLIPSRCPITLADPSMLSQASNVQKPSV